MTTTHTLQDLAERLEATLEGDPNATVHRCIGLPTAGPGDLSFLANARYLPHLKTTKAEVVLVGKDTQVPEGLCVLRCEDPYLAFSQAMVVVHGYREHPEPMDAPGGVSPRAAVHDTAVIGEGTRIHPFAVVEQGATVGKNCSIYPGAWIGPNASVGDDCLLFPNCVIYDGAIVGDRVTVHAGTVLGSDGFGFATSKGIHHKIPQQGIVRVEDDVEFGSNCAIERATMGETRIGEGTKFADLISIGHGTTIGSHCLLVSLVGVAGSVTMGNHVVLGGQSGVAGHLSIGDRVTAIARTGIVGNTAPDQMIGGMPAVPIDQARRNMLAFASLSKLAKRVRTLERAAEKTQADAPR
jgi:UDP-3-O-[3-hydroxymyristoyl] glucosamine N-acyltransferase